MKPILFNTEMVRAILAGRKMVTRRVVKFKKGQNPQWTGYIPDGNVLYGSNNIPTVKSPYRPGDILYVRETWKQATCDPAGGGYALTDLFLYKADEPINTDGMMVEGKWHPSIHMPREAARIFLRVTDVWVERLQDMQPYDIAFEGFRRQQDFKAFWDSTLKPKDRALYGWEANPWVWVIEFERCEKPEGD